MAKLSANGTEIVRLENEDTRYSFRSNGAILGQNKICGKWETWKHKEYFWKGNSQSAVVSYLVNQCGYKRV
jgi:hypothetical protein